MPGQTCKHLWKLILQPFPVGIAGIEPNVHAYTSLISLCQRANQWQKAMQIFRRMEAADVKVDVVAYNSAIAACAKGGDWEQAWAVFSSKRLHMRCQASASGLYPQCIQSFTSIDQSHSCISRQWLQMSSMYALSSTREGLCKFLAMYRIIM